MHNLLVQTNTFDLVFTDKNHATLTYNREESNVFDSANKIQFMTGCELDEDNVTTKFEDFENQMISYTYTIPDSGFYLLAGNNPQSELEAEFHNNKIDIW